MKTLIAGAVLMLMSAQAFAEESYSCGAVENNKVQAELKNGQVKGRKDVSIGNHGFVVVEIDGQILLIINENGKPIALAEAAIPTKAGYPVELHAFTKDGTMEINCNLQ